MTASFKFPRNNPVFNKLKKWGKILPAGNSGLQFFKCRLRQNNNIIQVAAF